MKRVLYVLAAALMVCVSSCSKDEQPVKADDVKMVQATIRAESSNTGDGTKTVATYDKDTQKYNITWEEGDELSVFNSKNSDMAKFKANASGATAQFEGEIPEGSEVTYAILPYDKDATVSGSTVYTSIPTEQNGDFYNVVLAGWPKDQTKAAMTYDFKYQFEAVCGIVKFSYDPARIAEGKTVTSISIVADRPVAGAAKIVYGGEKPVMSSNPNATGSNVYSVISIVKPEGFTKGEYYFSTFPISVEDNVEGMKISLRFDTSDGNVSYMSATLKSMGNAGNKHIFAANVVKNIGNVKVTGYTPHPFTSGEFSVAAGKKVTFSRGNLQYQASSNTWRFALNQWDAQGEVGNLTQPESDNDGERATQSAWIDLFPWGHSGFEYGGTAFVPYRACYKSDALYLRSQTGVLSGNYANGDWGKFCSIHNGDKLDAPGTWRLLSFTEFNYIAFNRNCTVLDYTQPDKPGNTFKIYFRFLRCGIDTGARDSKGDPIIRYGVMIFPDDFTWPEQFAIPGVYWGGCDIGFQYITNSNAKVYTLTEFAIFESAGVIFLPSAGQWQHSEQSYKIFIEEDTFNYRGDYWTTDKSASMSCYSGNIFVQDYLGDNTNIGRSVRLVKDVE